MKVSVYTDASFCPESKLGSYAFYIKCESGTEASCGCLKNCNSPEEAELMAIANALHTLNKSSFNNGRISFISIYSDCLNSFKKVSRRTKNFIGKKIFQIIESMKRISPIEDKRSMFFKLIHVKSHTGNQDGHSVANEYCDQMAKLMLKIQKENEKNSSNENKKVQAGGKVPGEVPMDRGNKSGRKRQVFLPVRTSQ